jgi:hypothetical protein
MPEPDPWTRRRTSGMGAAGDLDAFRDPPDMGGFGTFGVNRLQRTELACRAHACGCRLHPSGPRAVFGAMSGPGSFLPGGSGGAGHWGACRQGTRLGGLAGLSRGQQAKLAAIGIGHGHRAGLALADVDARCPETDQPAGLVLLITAGGWSEVEM